LKDSIKILLIEDDEDDYFILKNKLSKISYFKCEVKWITNLDKLEEIDKHSIDICIADYFLGKSTALDTLHFFKSKDINIPTIVLTGMNNREKDIEVMEAGAIDYLSKEKITSDKLERAIRYAIKQNKTLNKFKIERNKFQKLFELNKDLIIILDSSFKVNDLNSQGLTVLGIAKKEALIGKNIGDLIASPNMFEVLKRQVNIENKETDVVFFNGVKICAFLSLVEIFDENNLTECYQIIIKDITEEVKAKQRFRNIEKINFSGKMAQTLAHEIRNPLTNINLSVSFLKSFIEDEDQYLDMVQKNANKINEITTQFLNSTKAVELQLESVALQTVIDEAIELCIDRIHLKEISLNLAIDSILNKKVTADFQKLSIAISNLILNATEALEAQQNPSITIETICNENKVELSISDNGKGISEEKIKTIFEPFATDKKTGIGVGLSSVYNIIALHDWDIEVFSEVNVGTTFCIKLTLY